MRNRGCLHDDHEQIRRLVVRYERLIATYAGFFHLACAILALKKRS